MSKIVVVLALGVAALALFLGLQHRGSQPAQAAAVAASAAPAIASAPAAPLPAPPPPPARGDDTATCSRLADLCSTSTRPVTPASCEAQLADARKLSGDGNVARSAQCIADAKTCAAAAGCLEGGVGMGAMGEFLKGLGAAMSH